MRAEQKGPIISSIADKRWNQYQLEKNLADRLKKADKREREVLYTTVYNKLNWELPELNASQQELDRQEKGKPSPQLKWLKRLLTDQSTFIDIGAGNCKLALEVTNFAKQVYAAEASSVIARQSSLPSNFKVIMGDASSIELPGIAVNIAYSRQLIQRLHPDDALEHLKNVHKLLAPGGIYFCITPNRVFGPHDASRHFDCTASGLHLKEYSYAELDRILKQAGFARRNFYMKVWGTYMMAPVWPMKAYEFLMARLPHALRLAVGKWPIFKPLVNIRLVAEKTK